jgi:hypothetical protein
MTAPIQTGSESPARVEDRLPASDASTGRAPDFRVRMVLPSKMADLTGLE